MLPNDAELAQAKKELAQLSKTLGSETEDLAESARSYAFYGFEMHANYREIVAMASQMLETWKLIHNYASLFLETDAPQNKRRDCLSRMFELLSELDTEHVQTMQKFAKESKNLWLDKRLCKYVRQALDFSHAYQMQSLFIVTYIRANYLKLLTDYESSGQGKVEPGEVH